jgi:2Fe-2S ferredoxin
MAKVTFVQPDGRRQTVEIENGYTVMQGATANNVAGIKAECGGGCSCSTCHCYVEAAWFDGLAPMQDEEAGLLEFAWEPKQTSRLTCQLVVTDELDGLILYVPEQQL